MKQYNRLVPLTATPTISAAGIYAAGEAVGGLLTFTGAVDGTVLSGTITKVVIVDDDNEKSPLELVLFDRTFTATADNAAFDPTDADMENCIGVVFITTAAYSSFNDNSVATVVDQPLDIVLAGTSLFGQLITRGTPTYTATTDITVKLVIRQD